MKTLNTQLPRLALPLLFATLILQPATSLAQGAAFTYQGHLTEDGAPASGSNDLTFTLYDAVNGGATVGASNVVNDLAMTNGLFTVTLDFGAAFDGSARWLEIAVRPGASAGDYTNLIPRQPITSTPYALRALNAGNANTAAGVSAGAVNNLALASDAVDGTKILNGAISSADLNASLLNGTFWNLGGNAGTTPGAQFLGTSDNQPLEFKVNGVRALRLEPTAGVPNVIGGAANNQITAPSGGGGVLSGAGHRIFNASDYSVIAGGFSNRIQISSPGGFIGGGQFNWIVNSSTNSVIAGGASNQVSRDHAFIGGGLRQTNRSAFAFIGGGYRNDIGTGSDHSAISAGRDNDIADSSPNATIAGGAYNNIGTNSGSSAIGGGESNDIADNSPNATITGGGLNDIAADADSATIAGGTVNTIGRYSRNSVIGGGYINTIAADAYAATIAGGRENYIHTNSLYGAIGGGLANDIAANSFAATIPGGYYNAATNYAFAAGRHAKANHTGAFVWADSQTADFASTANNQFNIRASGGVRLSDDTDHLSFGSSTRQMIRLYGSTYAIGVQSSCLYQRSSVDFSWFQGGIHSDTRNDPGFGGVEMMRLRTTGLTVNGAFIGASDRNLKENFKPVDPRAVLDKVAALPLSEWNYKADTASRHVGPMAQDFYAAFGVGPDDKHIATVDADGVALAAIQGLNQKVEQKNIEIAELKSELEKLKQVVDKLVNAKD